MLKNEFRPCGLGRQLSYLHTYGSAKNRELLETIRRTSSQSLAELAERSGRKKPNLSRTLKTMEQYGLVQISRKKRKLVPRVRYQRVAVLMELRG